MRLELATAEYIGARAQQQDHATAVPMRNGALLVLADGLGGHESGAEAARIVVDTFREAAGNGSFDSPESRRQMLRETVERANSRIGEGVDPSHGHRGMASTAVAAVVANGDLSWVSVGDSHLYVWRGGRLAKLNEDHSQAGLMVKSGKFKPTDPEVLAVRSVLVSALTGRKLEYVDLPTRSFKVESGDVLLLASDGLNTLKDEEIGRIVADRAGEGAVRLSTVLLETVRSRRAERQDNATVVVARVLATAIRPSPREDAAALRTVTHQVTVPNELESTEPKTERASPAEVEAATAAAAAASAAASAADDVEPAATGVRSAPSELTLPTEPVPRPAPGAGATASPEPPASSAAAEPRAARKAPPPLDPPSPRPMPADAAVAAPKDGVPLPSSGNAQASAQGNAGRVPAAPAIERANSAPARDPAPSDREPQRVPPASAPTSRPHPPATSAGENRLPAPEGRRRPAEVDSTVTRRGSVLKAVAAVALLWAVFAVAAIASIAAIKPAWLPHWMQALLPTDAVAPTEPGAVTQPKAVPPAAKTTPAAAPGETQPARDATPGEPSRPAGESAAKGTEPRPGPASTDTATPPPASDQAPATATKEPVPPTSIPQVQGAKDVAPPGEAPAREAAPPAASGGGEAPAATEPAKEVVIPPAPRPARRPDPATKQQPARQ
jgi:serine/threonine protein phosphatase PrpC